MDVTLILDELKKKFGLKENCILILKALQYGDLPADKICKKTNIPKGRIYDFLNELVAPGLIRKIGKKPALYSIKDMNENIINFLDYEFNTFMENRKKILSILEDKGSEIIILINDKEEYTKEMIKLLAEGSPIKVINRENSYPFFLYPKDINKFINIRKRFIKKRNPLTDTKGNISSSLIFSKYLNLWNNKGKTFYIVTKNSLDSFFNLYTKEFGKQETKKRIFELKNEFKKYDVEIRIVKKPEPSNIILNPIKISEVVLHTENLVTGFVTSNEKIHKIYEDLFEEKWNHGENINVYLDIILKKLK